MIHAGLYSRGFVRCSNWVAEPRIRAARSHRNGVGGRCGAVRFQRQKASRKIIENSSCAMHALRALFSHEQKPIQPRNPPLHPHRCGTHPPRWGNPRHSQTPSQPQRSGGVHPPPLGGGVSRLRAERERLGLTQRQIEALLWGIPHRTYQDIESEARVPPPWVMAAILEKLSKRKSHANRPIV